MASLRRRCGGAFTLTELLAVLAIILLLGAFVRLALWRAEDRGRYTLCQSNLGQLGKLIVIYAQDHGGYLPAFWHERWVGELDLVGRRWGSLPHDLDPRIPTVFEPQGLAPWNKGKPVSEWTPLVRSGSPLILCRSDVGGYRCEQGCPVSYRGLAKYGWVQYALTPAGTSQRSFLYRQMQDVQETARAVLLAETEAPPPQPSDCLCRWQTYGRPERVAARHYSNGSLLHFDSSVRLTRTAEEREMSYWEPDFMRAIPGF